jgi:hypothetical protein
MKRALRPVPIGGPVNKAVMGHGDVEALAELRRLLAHFKSPELLHDDLNELRGLLSGAHAPPETLAVLLGLQCNTLDDLDRYKRLVHAGHAFFQKLEPPPPLVLSKPSVCPDCNGTGKVYRSDAQRAATCVRCSGVGEVNPLRGKP